MEVGRLGPLKEARYASFVEGMARPAGFIQL